MKRILSIFLIICMMLTLLTGCTNDAKIASDFKNDFQQDGKFLFHGLNFGITMNELLKKENIKKSDLVEMKNEGDTTIYTNFYLKTDEKQKLYGINGKVRRTYRFDRNGKYNAGGFIFYFDDERQYLTACKKIGKCLYQNFSNPDKAAEIEKGEYNENQAWYDFINPPKFSTWEDFGKSSDKFDVSSFEWGNPSKENSLTAERSPCVKKPNKDSMEGDLFKQCFITLYVSSKY